MAAKTSPERVKPVAVYMELSEDERARLIDEAREKYLRDVDARLHYKYQKRLEEGRREACLEVAKRLLLKKDPVETVAEVTGLSLEEIKALASELPNRH